VLLTAARVNADEPGSLQFSVIGSGLYGHELAQEAFEDPHGAGLDLRLGVTLPVPIYVGLSFSHFFGVESSEVLLSEPPIFVSHDATITQLLAHVGYDWDLKLVRLRPNVGLGFAHTAIDVSSAGVSKARTHAHSYANELILSPALEAMVPLGLLALCAQVRYDAVPNAVEARKVLVLGGGLGFGF
jgi:hypothetical protein